MACESKREYPWIDSRNRQEQNTKQEKTEGLCAQKTHAQNRQEVIDD